MTAGPIADEPEKDDQPEPEALEELLERQEGVLSRAQAIQAGITPSAIRAHMLGKRWQRVFPGIYATFTGSLSYDARVWAGVLYGGEGAVASHETAAWLWKIGDKDDDEDGPIHITIPSHRRVAPQDGLRIHRSRWAKEAAHPVASPPRTRLEETVVDLIDAARSFEEALTVVMRPVQRRRTTTARVCVAMAARKKLRWRRELAAPLDDIADGAQTMLELRYVRDVERPHGLPRGERQQRWTQDGTSRYTDVRYKKYRTRVELDGRIGHVEEGAFRDMERDNAGVLSGDVTLRFGWLDASARSCEAADQVGTVLQRNGWAGTLRRCGPRCRLPRP